MKSKRAIFHLRIFIAALLILFLTGCGGTKENPLDPLVKSLASIPTFSIILEDMNQEGVFSKQYFHKYRVVQEKNSYLTNWLEVPESIFKKDEKLLGMALISKKEGEIEKDPAPPGYAYVGDEKYGRWRNDSSGGTFWEFYGKYAFFSSLFGGWYRPIYNHDFDGYKRNKRNKSVYFGSKGQYGSSGSVARKQKPNFFAKKMSGKASSKSSFGSKVKSRVGRTKTSFRSRAGGVGK